MLPIERHIVLKCFFASQSPVIEHVNAGTLRALAAAATSRIPGLPNVPTAAEAGLAGFEIATWFGVAAPAKTPADIVQRLNGLIASISSDPAARKRLEDSLSSADEPFSRTIQATGRTGCEKMVCGRYGRGHQYRLIRQRKRGSAR